ncbi:putative endonuclease 4 [Thermogymnomonas acidicola]|uniref:Probable endonuclease 4 n=1 Tax=Thermogymnomonas acidicola TaxID=399579 RepID=A0AA37BQH5_9ARCH|nr:putative endonuclease 4 [Thermogymnomonas acidicola]
MTDSILLGGHVSTAGGLSTAPERASRFSFRTFQIFSKNQRQWKSKPLEDSDVSAFREGVRSMGMKGVMVHASYLLNLGSPDPDLRAKVLDSFADECRRVAQIGAEFLTFHPGSSRGTSVEKAIGLIAEAIDASVPEGFSAHILIETSAGQGNSVGHTFEQLAQIIDSSSRKEVLGICFDTCHVWAAGYDIRSREGYMETMDQFKSEVGLQRLMGFHLNDSKQGRGSRVDRHEQIGQGTLGLEGISNFVNDRRFSDIPMILETPLGEEGYGMDIEAIQGVLSDPE